MNNNGNEDTTKDLTDDLSDRQLLLLVLERVIRLEAAEEERKKETRPLWDRLEGQMTQVFVRFSAIETRLTAIEEEQKRVRHEIGLFRKDLYNERLERSYLEERVSVLEQAQASTINN
jgi:septal ring factor EnvC (AmiA/AmiB activator)